MRRSIATADQDHGEETDDRMTRGQRSSPADVATQQAPTVVVRRRAALTAAAISSRFFRSGTGRVYLTPGDDFPDALAAGPAAAADGAPLLLTASERITPQALDELARLAPEEVIVVGGTAISDDVRDAINDRLGIATGSTTSRARTATTPLWRSPRSCSPRQPGRCWSPPARPTPMRSPPRRWATPCCW